MRALLVDDEPRAREVLRYCLDKVGGVEVVGEASTGSEAVELARRLTPDAVFLDVRLPDLSGMEVAQLLAGLDPRPRVVFVTAYENHAVAAFEAEAVDYLVKPITAARVLQAVERLRRQAAKEAAVTRTAGNPPALSLPPRLPVEVSDERGRRTVLLETGAILLVEARGKGSVVRTARAEYETPTALATWEEQLPSDVFLRVHRGFVVNLSAVRELFTEGRTTFLRLEGRPEAVPVSRDRLAELRERLALTD